MLSSLGFFDGERLNLQGGKDICDWGWRCTDALMQLRCITAGFGSQIPNSQSIIGRRVVGNPDWDWDCKWICDCDWNSDWIGCHA